MIDPLNLHIPLTTTDVTIRPSQELPVRRLLRTDPDRPDDYIIEIDNSTLELLSICHRRFENYAIHSRQRAGDTSALDFGGLFHKCEELRLRHGISDSVIQRQRELVVEHFDQHTVQPEDHRTADRMLVVLNEYNRFYAADGWPEKTFMFEGEKFVERPFKVPICTILINDLLPYTYNQLVDPPNTDAYADPLGYKRVFVRNLHIIWTGKIDLILYNSNFLWVVDHKTSKEGGAEWEAAFRLARQTVGYAWAAQMVTGMEMAGCIINGVIVRPPAKTARATKPREEFQRLTYFYSQDRIAEWYMSVTYMLTDMANSLRRGYFPMTGPKSFKSPCVYCDYHENCQLPRAQRAADLATDLYRDVTWNPIHE